VENASVRSIVLDDAQRGVVSRIARRDGCLLVTGGPGSGKTTALVAAVARLVEDGVPLDRVVVLTHARPAAQRLRRQIMDATGGTQVGLRITTPHGWCQALMQATRPPEEPARPLINAPEQEYTLRELLDSPDSQVCWPAELGQAVAAPAFAAQLRFLLARARQLGMDPVDLGRAGDASGRADWVAAADFFSEYLNVLDVLNDTGVFDYAEVVHRCRILLSRPDVQALVRANTDVVLVDEFAESDESVVALLRDIWRCGVPVSAFGDATTAVFDFRGAWPAALRRFPGEFIDAKGPAPVIELTGVWRVPEVREALLADNQDDEAAAVAQRFWAARADGVEWPQMAAIARQSGPALARLAAGLAAAGLPVRVEGEVLALSHVPAVKVLVAAVQLLVDAAQAPAAQWVDVLCSPLVGLDEVDLRRLARVIDPSEAWQDVVVAGLGDECPTGGDATVWGAAKAALGGLTALVAKLDELSPGEAAWGVWTLAGWPKRLRKAALGRHEGALRANRDLDAVIAVFDLAGPLSNRRGGGGLTALIDLVTHQMVQSDRAREADTGDAVTVLSAYQAKGRGWPVVAVVGATEGAWPLDGWVDSLLEPERLQADGAAPATTRREQVAAQRRLFTLAVSRASRHLVVTGSPAADTEQAELSRFATAIGLAASNWHAGDSASTAISARALSGELRGVAISPDEAPGVVSAAAAGLARLGANPRDWWWVGGLTQGRDPLVGQGPARIRATAVGNMLDCPRAWFMGNQGGGAPAPTVSIAFGSLAHRLFEACASSQPDDLWVDAAQAWETMPFSSKWQAEAGWQALEQSLARYLVWRDGRRGRRLLGTEVDYRHSVDTPGGEVEITGRVDRLEMDESGRLVVIDFKTGKTPDPKGYLDQMAIYRLGVEQGVFEDLAPGVRQSAPPELVWPRIDPRVRGDSDVGCRVDQVTDEPPGGIIARLGQALEVLRSERFDATPGASCRNCDFRQGCPAHALEVDDDND